MMQRKYICKDIYSVNSGDTLYTIAKHYQVPIGLLMRANKITNPYNLRVGMQLCIPGLESAAPRNSPQETKPPAADPTTAKPAVENPTSEDETKAIEAEMDELEDAVIITPEEDGVLLYSIVAGDTLYMIAKRHRVTLQALMDANPDMDPYNLIIGMKIRIPLA